MSTLYQSSKDVPTEVLAARLNELADVVAQKRDRIGAEFTMRIPAECDRDADLVMSESAVRLEALQAKCEKLRKDAERYRYIKKGNQWIVAATQTGFHVDGEELDVLIDSELC